MFFISTFTLSFICRYIVRMCMKYHTVYSVSSLDSIAQFVFARSKPIARVSLFNHSMQITPVLFPVLDGNECISA